MALCGTVGWYTVRCIGVHEIYRSVAAVHTPRDLLAITTAALVNLLDKSRSQESQAIGKRAEKHDVHKFYHAIARPFSFVFFGWVGGGRRGDC
jgi:hypothetical protein